MLVTEDMKKMVQIPILRTRPAKNAKVFGASLSELQDRGLVEDGVPVVLRRLVEHLRRHGEKSFCTFISCSMLPCFYSLSAVRCMQCVVDTQCYLHIPLTFAQEEIDSHFRIDEMCGFYL